MHEVYDDFLKLDDLSNLIDHLSSDTFPWFLQQKSIVESSKKFDFHFGHNFYVNDAVNSNYFQLIKPLITQLKCNSLVRIKANLYPVQSKIFEPAPHIDQSFNCRVAVFFSEHKQRLHGC